MWECKFQRIVETSYESTLLELWERICLEEDCGNFGKELKEKYLEEHCWNFGKEFGVLN